MNTNNRKALKIAQELAAKPQTPETLQSRMQSIDVKLYPLLDKHLKKLGSSIRFSQKKIAQPKENAKPSKEEMSKGNQEKKEYQEKKEWKEHLAKEKQRKNKPQWKAWIKAITNRDVNGAWFDYEQFNKMQLIAPQTLPKTFEEWKESAETLEKDAREVCNRFIRAYVNAKEFTDWCAETHCEISSHARANYVAHLGLLAATPATAGHLNRLPKQTPHIDWKYGLYQIEIFNHSPNNQESILQMLKERFTPKTRKAKPGKTLPYAEPLKEFSYTIENSEIGNWITCLGEQGYNYDCWGEKTELGELAAAIWEINQAPCGVVITGINTCFTRISCEDLSLTLEDSNRLIQDKTTNTFYSSIHDMITLTVGKKSDNFFITLIDRLAEVIRDRNKKFAMPNKNLIALDKEEMSTLGKLTSPTETLLADNYVELTWDRDLANYFSHMNDEYHEDDEDQPMPTDFDLDVDKNVMEFEDGSLATINEENFSVTMEEKDKKTVISGFPSWRAAHEFCMYADFEQQDNHYISAAKPTFELTWTLE